jgi:protein-disulfide isomerase
MMTRLRLLGIFLGISLNLFAQAIDATKISSTTVQRTDTAAEASKGVTREQADAILEELRQIRKLLEKQQNAPTPSAQTTSQASMSLANDWYSLGAKDAPLILVEFADYECPFCRNFQSKTFATLKKNYIDTGKVHFIARDLPLDFHSRALAAAEAARCAGEQGKFWEMREMLISSPDLSSDTFMKNAETLALDAPTFRSCVEAEKYKKEILKDQADANLLQISGTPTFVLGKANNNVLNGVVIVGAQPYDAFDDAIQQMIGRK